MYEDPWEGSRSGLAMKLSPLTTVYVPFLHSTCPANSSSQLSNSPQELSLASLLGPKMWWRESIWMSKQETWGQRLWDTGMVQWFIVSLSTRRDSSPPPPRDLHFIPVKQLFATLKAGPPSVDKLRMTFNSIVTYVKLSDKKRRHAGLVAWRMWL